MCEKYQLVSLWLVVYYDLLIIHDSSDLMFQLGVQLVQKIKKQRYLEIICIFFNVWKIPAYIIMIDGL